MKGQWVFAVFFFFFFSARITPVFEHRLSYVTLHCEVTNHPDILDPKDVKVIWMKSDAVLEPTDDIEVVHPVSGF